MKIEFQNTPYPGSESGIHEILDLAEAYYSAAITLFQKAEKEAPLSYAPARLCSIHAIELYLNAFLRYQGVDSKEIRGRMHNLADPIFVEVLILRRKTAAHLAAMTEGREYLISRYAPDLVSQHTELNRLTSTLVEVMTKTSKHIRQS